MHQEIGNAAFNRAPGRNLDPALKQSIEAVLGWLTRRGPELEDTHREPARQETIEQLDTRLREKLRHHIKSGARPRLVDLEGRRLEADDFPLTGDDLVPRTELAILERLAQRMKEHPSAGQLLACVLEHLRYGIGTNAELSPTQVRFVKSICALTNLRPIPFLRLRGFILSSLDAPDTLRTLLTALLNDREHYVDKLRDAVRARIETLQLPASPRVAVLGYATSITVVLDEIAKSRQGKMALYIGSVPRPGRNLAAEKALQLALCRADVEYFELDDPTVQAGGFDLVLAGSKLVSASSTDALEIVNSAPYVRRLNDIRSAQPDARVAVATGLFKVWPRSFYEQTREAALKQERYGSDYANAPLSGDMVDLVVSELGWLAPNEFMAHWKVARLLLAEDVLSFGKILAASSEGTAPAPAAHDARTAVPPRRLVSGPENDRLLQPRLLAGEAERRAYARAAARFEELSTDPDWCRSRRGQFVAILGVEPPEELYGSDYFDVMTKAETRWPASPVFARRIPNPATPA